MQPPDYEAIQKIGINAALVLAILYGSFWMLKKILEMYDGHLKRNDDERKEVLKAHQEEREKWMSQYEKHTEKVDNAMKYQREEHREMMVLLREMRKSMEEDGRGFGRSSGH